MNPIIELQNLSVTFGRRPILKDLSIALEGRAIGLLGPNGAGKTTLIHTLLGFHNPSAGVARVLGLDTRASGLQVRADIGYMPERDSFVSGMSAVRFVRLMAELSGIPADAALERAHEALFFVGLGEARYRPIDTYSLGMKQMAKLAQSVVHGPRLIILDEPTNGLDPPARQRMLNMIKTIRDSGNAHILFSSHLLRDVEEVCEEVLILRDGQIAAYCNLAEERRLNKRFLELEIRGDIAAFATHLSETGCEWARLGERRMKVVLSEGVEVVDLYRIAQTRSVQIRRLNFKRDSLDDIFLKAMEGTYGSV